MFEKCKTVQDVKILYRKLALHLHPDHGGDNELMSLLVETMQKALDGISEQNVTLPEGFEETEEPVLKGSFRVLLLATVLGFCNENDIELSEFVLSVKSYYDKRGYMTVKQYNALYRIYNSLIVKGIEEYWEKERPFWVKIWSERNLGI